MSVGLSVVAVLIYVLTVREVTGSEVTGNEVTGSEVADEVWNCTINSGNPHFQLRMLCGKKVYVMYMSGNEGNYSCVVACFTCFSDDTVCCNSTVFQHGESYSKTSWLTDLGNGVVLRESKTESGKSVYVRDMVTSFTVFASGDVKVGYYICGNPPGDNHPVMRAIVSTLKNVDLTDDVKLMNNLFPCGGLYYVPNHCDVNDYY